jgi:hypothetical protein
MVKDLINPHAGLDQVVQFTLHRGNHVPPTSLDKNPDSPSNRQTFLTGNPPSSLVIKYHKISPCFERQGNGFPLT